MPDTGPTAQTAWEPYMVGAVDALTRRFTSLWWEAEPAPPSLGPALTEREQSAREVHLDRFLAAITSELKNPPRSGSERQAVQERISGAFASFARSALDFEQRHLDMLLQEGFTHVGTGFAQEARRFDASVSGADIFQALRNAWTMSGMQRLLGLPVRLTPAMFAYSMLYPYTDNYLDDPTVPEETKRVFNRRFGLRLTGEDVPPSNAQERIIYELVGKIEGQYDRSTHPEVHESLLAIHRAQIRSVQLMRRDASPYEVDVLGIAVEKGGCSVLADGYLAAGTLRPDQARLMFGFGAFLQLADDLQDVEHDAKDGLQTVFSQTSRRWPLDAVTSRTFHFGRRVLDGLDCFDAPGVKPLKELMRKSSLMLLTNAAGAAARLYNRAYIQTLEAHSPFRFSYLAQARKKMARERVSLMRLVEAFGGDG